MPLNILIVAPQHLLLMLDSKLATLSTMDKWRFANDIFVALKLKMGKSVGLSVAVTRKSRATEGREQVSAFC